MSTELRIASALLLAGLVTAAAVPWAIRLATATGFLDHPVGRKEHAAPTPYLGGTAVLLGFAVAGLAFGQLAGRFWAIAVGALAMWAIGTLDDRVALGAGVRVAAAAGAGLLLWAAGLGWSDLPGGVLEPVLTVLWIVAVVNSLNLFDNLDGATGSVAAVAAAMIGVLAAVRDDTALACLSVALCGACVGFLPFNLALPRARLFLGDGGSMPIGFVLAAVAMALPLDGTTGTAGVATAVLLLAVPLTDTLLVIVSRRRRRISIFTPGRDHLTHRLLARQETPRRVALTVALAQALLSTAAVVSAQHGGGALALLAGLCAGLALLTVFVFERSPGTVLSRGPAHNPGLGPT